MANDPSEDLDALLARLMVAATRGKEHHGLGVSVDSVSDGAKTKTSGVGLTQRQLYSEEHDSLKTLSDQVSEKISRQIYDELDAQMMANLEKCHEEQSRRLDEELDRQLQEQLDTMLEANVSSELEEDEHDIYDYYSEDEGDYSSDDDERMENLPWSEGGEGGIRSLGLADFAVEHDNPYSYTGSVIGAHKYSEEELEEMVDNLYGEEGATLPGPGAWGRGRWRPEGDTGDSST